MRQIAHRARSHVQARRPRQDVTPAERDACSSGSSRPAATGDLQSLMDVLAPDVVLITDGGGHKKAALRPILGPRQGAAVPGGRRRQGPIDRSTSSTVNGGPALALRLDGELDTVVTLPDRGRPGHRRSTSLRNPEKLRRLGQVVDARPVTRRGHGRRLGGVQTGEPARARAESADQPQTLRT